MIDVTPFLIIALLAFVQRKELAAWVRDFWHRVMWEDA